LARASVPIGRRLGVLLALDGRCQPVWAFRGPDTGSLEPIYSVYRRQPGE